MSFEGLLIFVSWRSSPPAPRARATLRQPSGARPQALGRGDSTPPWPAARTGAGRGARAVRRAPWPPSTSSSLERARALLDRILARDPGDGEAWLEAVWPRRYAGDLAAAERAFAEGGPLRSDLLESLTLHRAWLALKPEDS